MRSCLLGCLVATLSACAGRPASVESRDPVEGDSDLGALCWGPTAWLEEARTHEAWEEVVEAAKAARWCWAHVYQTRFYLEESVAESDRAEVQALKFHAGGNEARVGVIQDLARAAVAKAEGEHDAYCQATYEAILGTTPARALYQRCESLSRASGGASSDTLGARCAEGQAASLMLLVEANPGANACEEWAKKADQRGQKEGAEPRAVSTRAAERVSKLRTACLLLDADACRAIPPKGRAVQVAKALEAPPLDGSSLVGEWSRGTVGGQRVALGRGGRLHVVEGGMRTFGRWLVLSIDTAGGDEVYTVYWGEIGGPRMLLFTDIVELRRTADGVEERLGRSWRRWSARP